jgi:hypothetical protein
MKTTGMMSGIEYGATYYRDELKRTHPDLPSSFNKELDTKLAIYVEDIKKYYIKLYSAQFTPEDIKHLQSFFSSSTGKKFSKFNKEFLPQISQYTADRLRPVDKWVEDQLEKLNQTVPSK